MISSDEDRKMFGMCVDSFSFKHRINNHHLKRDDKKNPFTKGISLGKGTRHV